MTPLHAAVEQDNLEIIELLLALHADPLAVSKGNGETPVHLSKRPEVTEMLIHAKADINARDEWLMTPLHREPPLSTIPIHITTCG